MTLKTWKLVGSSGEEESAIAIRYTEDLQSPECESCKHPDHKHDAAITFAQAVDEFEARHKRELVAKMKEQNSSSVEIAAMLNHRKAYEKMLLDRLKQAFDPDDDAG